MLKKIRGKLIWLGPGGIVATWLSYEYSANWVYSLILGMVVVMGGLVVMGFYAAEQADE